MSRMRVWVGLAVACLLSRGMAEGLGRGEDWQPQAGWRALFNGENLDGWYTFLQEHGKNRDPDGIITIEDGAIHLYKNTPDGSRVVMGYIATEQEYANYHLRLQYKWGTKKFEPRLQLKRDAGLYYHIIGEDAVWPRSLQCQIQEGDVGDLLALYGVQVDTWTDPTTAGEEQRTFLEPADGGVATVLGGTGIGYQKRRGMYELEGWNTLEIIVNGTSVTHVLNGKVVNRAENARYVDVAAGGSVSPVAKGRIAIEIEAAEIYFRRVEIRELPVVRPEKAARLRDRLMGRGLRVGAAAANLSADDSMVIAGGIGPWNPKGQEGELRATAVVLEKRPFGTFAIVACDVLFVTRDLVDAALTEIEGAAGIPPEHVLVNATHTHSAPSTVRVHGYGPEKKFRERLKQAIVDAVVEARANLEKRCTFAFGLGAEYSVGENSRLLLSDGSIFWTGPSDDRVRPTAPFDPELPTLAFRDRDGALRAVIYNHSTHTIGTVNGMVRSPSFYGLAAQELEREFGGLVSFLEGASGSTHNLTVFPTQRAVERVKAAVFETLAAAEPRRVDRIDSIKRPFTFRVRRFDEAAEDEKVASYCRKRTPQGADYTIDVFRKMREELRSQQGEERSTWLQAMRIGDVAIVGVPAEFFTVLGIEVKRRSPFAFTYVAELANDWIGYVGDKEAYERGGYQTWMGLHSYCEVGTGERIVEETVNMLGELRGRDDRVNRSES